METIPSTKEIKMATKKYIKMSAMENLAEQINNLQFSGSHAPETQEAASEAFDELAHRLVKRMTTQFSKFKKREEAKAAKLAKKEARKQALAEKQAERTRAKEMKALERETKKAERLALKEEAKRAKEEAKSAPELSPA